jgi:14-3-3 protein epsilon
MEDLIFRAKLAEQSERHDDMIKIMKEVLAQTQDLTVEQRNLLSVGYKNAVGLRRNAWRSFSSLEQKEEKKGNEQNVNLIKIYREKIEQELNDICGEIIGIINDQLVPSSTTADSKVFFFKMSGDYYRYLSEFQTVGANKAKYGSTSQDGALNAYEEAAKIANADLAPTHPIRLGLALNFSVFYYEVLDNSKEACTMAKKAFDDAIAELDNLDEEQYKDSTTIMQLLRDNLTLWTSEAQEAEADAEVTDL